MMDLDQHCLCPHCSEPMQVSLPIWVTPGEDVDTSDIDWESSTKKNSLNWWCPECSDHHFPLDNEGLA